MGKACKHECETRNSYKIWLENFEGKFQIEDKLMCHSLTPSSLSSPTHSLTFSLTHSLFQKPTLAQPLGKFTTFYET